MEKKFGSWTSPYQYSSGFPIHMGQPCAMPTYMNHYSDEHAFGTRPVFLGSVMEQTKQSEPNDSRNWLHCLPYFNHSSACLSSPVSRERLTTAPLNNSGVKVSGQITQKKFLVFDQSGGKTTLIHSSGVNANPPPQHVFTNKEARETRSPLGAIMNVEFIEDGYKHDMKSGTHEDTEELNALLFSDSDGDDSEDDEETSTAHSPPSTMTHCHVPDLVKHGDVNVLRSAEPAKRQKLLDGGYDVQLALPLNAAWSMKDYASSELEDDAESSCGPCDNAKSRDSKELGTISGKKRSRKDKVVETVNILRKIVPGGKGKDAIVVIDEAICYLKSLKANAELLGLDAP